MLVVPVSLRRRLLAAAALWITLALLLVGVLLVALFRQHAEAELAARAAAPAWPSPSRPPAAWRCWRAC